MEFRCGMCQGLFSVASGGRKRSVSNDAAIFRAVPPHSLLFAAGTQLLRSAQQDGVARKDVDGDDLFALIGAAGWIGDQPAFEDRADRLVSFIATALMWRPQESDSASLS